MTFPLDSPDRENPSWMYLPKRDEFEFLRVLALPKDSSSGVELEMAGTMPEDPPPEEPPPSPPWRLVR